MISLSLKMVCEIPRNHITIPWIFKGIADESGLEMNCYDLPYRLEERENLTAGKSSVS
jgi:hypothetical protein